MTVNSFLYKIDSDSDMRHSEPMRVKLESDAMLTTGNQLRAARALVGMDQTELAKKAEVSPVTIGAMERKGTGPIGGRYETVRAIQRVLEAAGVEFLNDGQPGVRLAATTKR